VVPDEATLAAMLAQEVADAMEPKSYQDQYGFSDVLRLSSTEILKRVSFQNEKKETESNSLAAIELLKKSLYAVLTPRN
jgi:non-homologous end joining protein Ku